jgi:hypothetical protein
VLLSEQNDEWPVRCRYLSGESMALVLTARQDYQPVVIDQAIDEISLCSLSLPQRRTGASPALGLAPGPLPQRNMSFRPGKEVQLTRR